VHVVQQDQTLGRNLMFFEVSQLGRNYLENTLCKRAFAVTFGF
jgi:hypothetical protein